MRATDHEVNRLKRVKLTLLFLGAILAATAFLMSQAERTGPAQTRADLHATPRSEPSWVDRMLPKTKQSQPNILLVVYDARRRDDFSFGPFGQHRADTPFLADFKNDAVFFEDAIAPGCWTVPVHGSIFSGLSVRDLEIDWYNPGQSSFPDEFLSLAEILQWAATERWRMRIIPTSTIATSGTL